MDWETISATETDILERTPIEGGYIIRNRYVVGGSTHSSWTWAVSIAFMADTAAQARRREHHK